MADLSTNLNATAGASIHAIPVSSRWIEVVSAIYLFCITTIGVTENAVLLYVYSKNKQFVTKNNIPIIALLVNSLVMATLGLPFPFIAEISGGWHVHLTDSLCTFTGFAMFLFGLASLYILLEITLSRYITITSPMGAIRLTSKHALVGVFTSYALAAIYAICPLFGFGSYGLEAHGTSCGLDYRDRSDTGRIYRIALFIGCFLLPISLMVMSYASIFKVVTKASILPAQDATSLRVQKQKRRERKLLKLSVTMVGAFLMCWSPYAIITFYIDFGNPGDLHPLVTRIPALFAKSEVVWNPLIYTLQTRIFRHEVYKVIPITWLREKLLHMDADEAAKEHESEKSVSEVSKIDDDDKKEPTGKETTNGEAVPNQAQNELKE